MPSHLHPSIIRGDIGFGNEDTMSGWESRRVKFLLKLKQSVNVKKLIEQLEKSDHLWQDAGDGWKGYETHLKLMGWSCSRRVIVLRRPASKKNRKECGNKLLPAKDTVVQEELFFPQVIEAEEIPKYDWAVLVTSLNDPIVAISQLYRDRGDCENIFDKLKINGDGEALQLTTSNAPVSWLALLRSYTIDVTFSVVWQFLKNILKQKLPGLCCCR